MRGVLDKHFPWRERAGLLQIFEEQRSMSAELVVMMALNLK